MLGSLLRRLTGQRPEPARPPVSPPSPVEETRADAPAPLENPAEADLQVSSLEAPNPAATGIMGKSPVFSSRAVRDATVVTGTIESLTRFVEGQDVMDDLTWRLESLTPDQVNFLQLSAEPGLIQRAQARSEVLKGAKPAALRKLLTDLASGAIPEPVNRTNPLSLPKGPIVPPLASLQPRPVTAPADTGAAPAPTLGPANPAAPGPGTPSLTTAPPLAMRPIPPAPAKPVPPPPVPPAASPPLRMTPAPARSEPALAKAPDPKPVEPAPVAKMAETPVMAPAAPAPLPKSAGPEPTAKPAASVPETKTPVPASAPKAADPVATMKAPVPESVAAAVTPKGPEPVKAAEPPKAVEPAGSPSVEPTGSSPVEPPRSLPLPEPPPVTPSVPRLGRHDAEARRARLLASLNDTLSSSEAAP